MIFTWENSYNYNFCPQKFTDILLIHIPKPVSIHSTGFSCLSEIFCYLWTIKKIILETCIN